MTRLLTIILFLLLFLHAPLGAAPALFTSKQEPPRHVGVPLRERFASRTQSARMLAPASYPTPTVSLFFLRVEFQPEEDPAAAHTTGSGRWNDPLYAEGTPANADDPNDPAFNYWVERARTRFVEYWNEVSYGLLPIEVTASANVYRLPHLMSYYGSESDAALQNLIYDSVATAMTGTEAVDFSRYDAVLIIHAGVGEETDQNGDSENDIWSLYYSDASISPDAAADGACSNCLGAVLKDGKPVKEAIIMPQTDTQDGVTVDPLGVYVHEFGHWLGLPDLYCVGALCQDDGPGGGGRWTLMADGIYNVDPGNPWYGSTPAHLDAWSKVRLGWVSPETVTPEGAGARTLGPAETDRSIIRMQASTTTPSQYFLIENRQQTGFDTGVPGHGLLIWLVDDEVVARNYASNTIESDRNRPGIKLIEADNDWSLMNFGCSAPAGCGSDGDPFPGAAGNRHLTPKTAPSSAPYSPAAWVAIHDIAESDPTGTVVTVTAFFGFTPRPPHTPGMNLNVVSWPPSTEAGVTAYNVYKNGALLGQTASAFYPDADARNSDAYRITAVSALGDESDFSGQVVANMQISEGEGGGCFIATAAYGSSLDPHVEALRRFRDRHLLTSAAGRMFVTFYYRHSPPAAGFIGRHDVLRAVARWLLTPVVYAVKFPKAFFLSTAMLLLSGTTLSLRRRRSRRARQV